MAKHKKKIKARGRKAKSLRGVFKSGMVKELIPPAVGLGLTASTAVGIRATLQPVPGTTGELVYRWAPAIGMGAGAVGGMVMYMLGGAGAARSAVLTSVMTGAALLGMEALVRSKPEAYAAIFAPPVNGAENGAEGAAGLRAIVPEYPMRGLANPRGMGAIVMEQLNGNQQNQGADIQLRGVVNTGAFGNSFGA